MFHGVLWFLGLTTQDAWPYELWSGFGAFFAALFDFGMLASFLHLWRSHRRLIKSHHEDVIRAIQGKKDDD